MNYIMYCCFGDYRYFVEMMYSIQSLIKTNCNSIDKYTFVIFVDSIKAKKAEDEVKALGIKYIIEAISKKRTEEWTTVNGKKYMPRVKIKAIDYFFKKYKTDVLFLDTDTIVLKNLLPVVHSIRDGNCFLYTRCLSIDEFFHMYSSMKKEKVFYDLLFHYRLCKRIKKNGLLHFNEYSINISSDFHQFNSGVIGVPYSAAYLLDSVLSFSDYLFYNFYFYWSEEFAFSFFLSENFNLISCDTDVYHYSSDKWCRLLLRKSLNKCYGDFEDLNGLIHEIINEKISATIELKEIPYLVKQINDESKNERIPYYDKTSRHIH